MSETGTHWHLVQVSARTYRATYLPTRYATRDEADAVCAGCPPSKRLYYDVAMVDDDCRTCRAVAANAAPDMDYSATFERALRAEGQS